jgi:peptidoglycan/LPS O-acetylase OafA/YrhL
MYIDAWPVQQIMQIILGEASTVLLTILLSVAVTIPLAFLSARLVEEPVQRWRTRHVKREAVLRC